MGFDVNPMILLVAALIILWFALKRSRFLARLDAKALDRLIKLGASGFVLLSAVVVFLRGHAEVALLLLGGGIYLFNLARVPTRAKPRAAGPRADWQRVRSAMIEMEFDRASGAMRGLVLAGPSEGARLDRLTRSQCEALYAACRTVDREGARLLEAYFDRRFAGWREAGQGDRDAWRERARHPNRMTEEEAHQVLGLSPRPSRDDIVRAHRSLMKKLHPDQGGSTDGAARVNEAKEVLMRRHS